jgi:hypothetical protein
MISVLYAYVHHAVISVGKFGEFPRSFSSISNSYVNFKRELFPPGLSCRFLMLCKVVIVGIFFCIKYVGTWSLSGRT